MTIATVQVHIDGSTGTPYIATFTRDGDSLQTACSCPAGEKRTHCKHRLALFSGDFAAVRGTIPPGLAEQLSAMVRGTEVEKALQELEAAQAEAIAATERLKRAKKFLDRAMHL
jgi:hypothetical protein